MPAPFELDAVEEIVREIVRAEHIEDGLLDESAFHDLFATDEANPGGSSCIRLKLTPNPKPTPPRDGLAKAQVGRLPRALQYENETWDAFAASVTDNNERADHAEVRVRRASDAPDVSARRPHGNGKQAKAFRKLMRMKVALAFHPI